ncbi:hypothetical protein B0H13DRAFT_2260462 [Mycena leptocephala]|nr:hypothetical protein B0H13DRAFT_2260462 [Mycena leptocephala]
MYALPGLISILPLALDITQVFGSRQAAAPRRCRCTRIWNGLRPLSVELGNRPRPGPVYVRTAIAGTPLPGNCKPGLWYCGKYLLSLSPKYENITAQAAYNGQLDPRSAIPDTLMLCNSDANGTYAGLITRVGQNCGAGKCIRGVLDNDDFCAPI